MAENSAPVMYWAVRTTLCSEVKGGAFATPSGEAASQDALDGAAV